MANGNMNWRGLILEDFQKDFEKHLVDVKHKQSNSLGRSSGYNSFDALCDSGSAGELIHDITNGESANDIECKFVPVSRKSESLPDLRVKYDTETDVKLEIRLTHSSNEVHSDVNNSSTSRDNLYRCTKHETTDTWTNTCQADYENGCQTQKGTMMIVKDEIIDNVVCKSVTSIPQGSCHTADSSVRLSFMQRQMAFDQGTGSGSSEHANDSVAPSPEDDDRFATAKIVVNELGSKPSHHPNLCSPTSVEGQLSHADSRDSTCDGLSRVSSVSSADSLVSDSFEYEVDKRNPKILKINGGETNLTRIETVKYKYRGKRCIQHYVKCLKQENREVIGDIGLRPKDLLLSIEGRSLENIKQKKILKLFKQIKPTGKGKIRLTLTFRRWEGQAEGTDEFEVDYKLELTLDPENDDTSKHILSLPANKIRQKQFKRRQSFKVSQLKENKIKETPVPPGQIDHIEEKGEVTGRLRVVHGGPDEYITAGVGGQVLIQVPTQANKGDNVFTLSKFEAVDKAPEAYPIVFLTRISPRGRKTKTHLMSDISNRDIGLRFKVSSITTASLLQSGEVDESFFIIRQFGDQILFESLVFRGYYVSCTDDDNTSPVNMVKKSDSDIQNDRNLEACKFEYYGVDSDTLPESEHSGNTFSRLFGLIVSCVSCKSSRNQTNANSRRRPVLSSLGTQRYRGTAN